MPRWEFQHLDAIVLAVVLAIPSFALSQESVPGDVQFDVAIDARAQTTPFPHFWEQMFGSGHAILSLRESYRDDLRAVKQVTDFKYVRFHGILDDEVGVYNEDEHGNPVYNFSYVDQIYDGLLKNGARPFVEIGFMPRKLAFNPDALHVFWYKPNVSPPKSMERWDDLVAHFGQHLVDRYGIDEVSQWYFEVWNEPNIDFWGGIPRQGSYFDLYAHTARALKSVNARLRVGGPATAAAAWMTAFLKFTSANHVPVDFVSTHAYADDTVENLLGTNEDIPMDERICRAMGKVKDEIKSSPMPDLPLFLTEWNVQGTMDARDTTFAGPALANTVGRCDGVVNMMSYWTFSDVFEEEGPIPKPFINGYGLRAKGGIDKPSFYAFELLHQLGDERLATTSKDVIATRDAGGEVAIAAWNLVDPGQAGKNKTMDFTFSHLPIDARVRIQRLDADHGNVLQQYAAMGGPLDPTADQVEQLNRATALPVPLETRLKEGRIEISLTPNSLVLIRVQP
jgi:xylan 1,4-beta-xylosidase